MSEYHGNRAAEKAKAHFNTVFAKKGLPDEMSEFSIDKNKINIVDLMKEVGFASSTSEARRLVNQNAVSIDGEKVDNIETLVDLNKKSKVLKVGKRRFCKVFRA